MPEIKNTFLKSKMNKDLDARLVPNGEYRDAQNLSVSNSEGADVGSLENILGNTALTNIKDKIANLESEKLEVYYNGSTIPAKELITDKLEIIGYYAAVAIDTVFLFITDFRDASNDQLSNFAPADQGASSGPGTFDFYYKGAMCYIAEYNLNTGNTKILVGGNFLNFSKTHPILNVNLLEDLLFWTDNRNQPRKINIKNASLNLSSNGSWESWDGSRANFPYYYNEDHISVAKFAPYKSIEFVDSSNNSTLISNNEEFLAPHIVTSLASASKAIGDTVIDIAGNYVISGNNRDIIAGDKITMHNGDAFEEYIVSSVVHNGANTDITIPAPGLTVAITNADRVILISRANPEYNSNYKGDINLLKDKFSKFSYRFKYDDGEYSLMAPFTQAAFIPEQFGYFINDDEEVTAESGNIKFMENRIDQVKLNIQLPYAGDEIENKLKVKELQILVKNSDELAVRVIEDVDVSKLGTSTNYEYDYLSTKAIKALPEADLIRVHDKIPVKALAQELISNRVVYANYLDKHSSPDSINYDLTYTNKSISNTTDPITGKPSNLITRELPNHTLKQNRSYQVGIVLIDRYGRASNVILNNAEEVTSGTKNSTIYAPYTNFNDPAYTQFFGKQLNFILRTPIPNSIHNRENYPGIYSSTNPLGYYSYRIVVKQQEQEYYNVYTPGALAGELLWDVVINADKTTSSTIVAEDSLPRFVTKDRISMINLFGDNINKIPRELKEVNSNDTTYSSRTIIYNRVNPIYDDSIGTYTERHYNKQSNVNLKGEKVITIEPFRDLGAWTTTKGKLFPAGNELLSAGGTNATAHEPQPWYPYYLSGNQYNFHDIFFNAQANPFIATIETEFKIGSTPDYSIPSPNQKQGIERAWQDLSVFETEPTKSALDIYFESSTSGLITDLNDIASDTVPAGIRDSSNNKTILGENINYIHDESISASVSSPVDVTQELFLTNSLGVDIGTNFDVVIQSVTNGSQLSRISDFVINRPSSNSFKIQTVAKKVFLDDSFSEENYTFNLGFTDTSGSSIWTGVYNIQLTNCAMQNIAPTWSTQPSSQYTIFSRTSTGTAPVVFDIVRDPSTTPVTGSIKANNGSSITSRNTEQIVYELVNDPTIPTPSGLERGPLDEQAFEITQNSNSLGRIQVKLIDSFYNTYKSNIPSPIPGLILDPSNPTPIIKYFYSLKVKATDANGSGIETLSNTFLVQLVLS